MAMSADDARHRAPPTAGRSDADPAPLSSLVAADLPAEYREAYLEGFERVRAEREGTAA